MISMMVNDASLPVQTSAPGLHAPSVSSLALTLELSTVPLHSAHQCTVYITVDVIIIKCLLC